MRFDQKEEQEIVRLYWEGGFSVASIALAMKCGPNTVVGVLRRNGGMRTHKEAAAIRIAKLGEDLDRTPRDPTPEEIEERAAEQRRIHLANKRGRPESHTKPLSKIAERAFF